MSSSKNQILDLESNIQKVLDNAGSDRILSLECFRKALDLIYASNTTMTHQTVGPSIAKYMENMQRANDQIIKVLAMLEKIQSTNNSSLSEEDKEMLKDMLEEEGNNKKKVVSKK